MTARSPYLDLIRGVAALLVCASHARAMLFVDYQDSSRSAADIPFYALTGLGHASVLIFFALSGFLVGGGVIAGVRQGTWRIGSYAARRGLRLWITLLPALVLTLLCDLMLRRTVGPEILAGAYSDVLSSGPSAQLPADFSAATFIGNALFLQTIVTPVFGTNGPLWSLAYEAWYYAIAPLLIIAVLGRGRAHRRAFAALSAVVALAALPINLTALGLIWAAGALAATVKMSGRAMGVVIVVAAVVWFGSRHAHTEMPEVAIGVAAAFALPLLNRLPNPPRIASAWACGLSEISFTLYLTHFPLALLVWATALGMAQHQVSGWSISLFLAFLIFLILAAWAMWWCFERNTAAVSSWAFNRFGVQKNQLLPMNRCPQEIAAG